MFRKTTSFYALAAAAVFGAGLAVSQVMPSAEAQSSAKAPVILVVDSARLIATSKAGQSIGPQLETMEKAAGTEYEGLVNQLVKDAEELKGKKETMGQEDYAKQAQQLAVRQQNMPVFREIKSQELSLSQQKAVGKIAEAMEPILQEIVDARGATVLLERGEILYASPEVDITQEALQKLDAKLTNVTVEKVSLMRKKEEGE